MPIIYARRRGAKIEREKRNRAYIDYAVAGALGFGFAETVGYLYVSCESTNQSLTKSVFTLAIRVVAGQVGHVSVAALTALRAIRRDYYREKLNLLQVIGPSILLHGAYNFVAMIGSTLEGNVGWIQPTSAKIIAVGLGLIGSLVSFAIFEVNREWKVLEIRDRLAKSLTEDRK